MLKKIDVLEAVYSDPKVDELSIQLAATGTPVNEFINAQVDKLDLNNTQAYVVRCVVKALEDELARLAAEEGTTKGGKFWRALYRLKIAKAFSLLFEKKM